MNGFGKTQFQQTIGRQMSSTPSSKPAKRPLTLNLVIAIVGLEALVVAGLALITISQIVLGQSRSISTALALGAVIAGAAALVILIVIGLIRGKRWARSAALFWQLVQLSIALGSFTGETPNALIGWALIVPSALVLILLFQKSVISATMAEMDKDQD